MRTCCRLFCVLTILAGRLIASDAWIDSTIEYTINTKFDKALSVIERQLQINPDDYRAHFYLAATLNSRMTHFENQDDAESIRTIN